MRSDFSQRYPEFAAVEENIRRAQAERAVVIGTWFADAIVGAYQGIRGLLSRSAATPLPNTRMVVKASLPR